MFELENVTASQWPKLQRAFVVANAWIGQDAKTWRLSNMSVSAEAVSDGFGSIA